MVFCSSHLCELKKPNKSTLNQVKYFKGKAQQTITGTFDAQFQQGEPICCASAIHQSKDIT